MTRRQFSTSERLFGVKCWFCGRREREREKVHNHHMDGNKRNNRRENQAWVCLNCHEKVSLTQKPGHPLNLARLQLTESRGEAHVCENLGVGASSLSGTDPKRTSSEERGDEILQGLLRYLNEVALPLHETREMILLNAGPWINRERPPSEPALRRRLKMFTESRYYPFRFDPYNRIYLDAAEPVRKSEPKTISEALREKE